MKLLIGGLLASGVLVASMAAVIQMKNREESDLRNEIAAYSACEAAVTHAELAVSAARCSTAVAAVHAAAIRAAGCDRALAGSDAFGVAAACSAPVKRVVADRDVRTGERDRAREQLVELRRGQAAAIASAEARGRTQTQRTERAETDLAAAPRTDAGLGRCDADCLRNLGVAPDAR